MFRNRKTDVSKLPSVNAACYLEDEDAAIRSAVLQRLIQTHVPLLMAGLLSTLFWVVVCLFPVKFLTLVSFKIYDVMHHHIPQSSERGLPVIIDIDEKSLAEIGQWPWPRYTVARLLTKLQDMEAAAVGLDIVFSEPDRTSIHVLEKDLSSELRTPVRLSGYPDNYRDNDAIFADALAGGPFVLGYPFFFSPKPDAIPGDCALHPLNLMVQQRRGADADDLKIPKARDITCNIKRFSEAAPGSGFFNSTPDADGVLRRVPMVIAYRNRFYPSLALATYIEAVEARSMVLKTAGNAPESLLMAVDGVPIRIPLDKDGRMLLRYYGSGSFFEYISAVEVLNGRIPAERLAGRVVFVGSSAPALGDLHPTPLKPLVPGIEVHATAAQNILTGEFIARPWWIQWAEASAVLLAGLFSTALLIWRKTLAGFLLIGVTAVGIWFGSEATLIHTVPGQGLFISPLIPLIALISNFSTLTLIKFIREELRNRAQTYLLLKAQELTLHSLASLAETRDDETGNHLIRSQHYVRLLAEYLSRCCCDYTEFASGKAITYLYKSAPLHDIGKVGIPDAILLKPARLTDEEFEEMKRHTEYGRQALARAEERLGLPMASPYFHFAKEIAYSHHERWAGGGYPKGLSGNQIPPAGRIMALADVYDALRTKRVYKPAYSHAKARAIILEGRGSHFDPDVVDAFIALEERFIEIFERFADPDEAPEE